MVRAIPLLAFPEHVCPGTHDTEHFDVVFEDFVENAEPLFDDFAQVSIWNSGSMRPE